MRLRATSLITLMLISISGWSQETASLQGKYYAAGLNNDREVEQFFLSFKEAVARGDKQSVALMISYPIRVTLASGRRVTIKNRTQFVQKHDAIFDPVFKGFLKQTRVEDLWAKWSGVATPHGEIWFDGIIEDEKKPEEHKIKITTINGVFDKHK